MRTFCSLRSPIDSTRVELNGITSTLTGAFSEKSFSSGPMAPFISSTLSDAVAFETFEPRPLSIK